MAQRYLGPEQLTAGVLRNESSGAPLSEKDVRDAIERGARKHGGDNTEHKPDWNGHQGGQHESRSNSLSCHQPAPVAHQLRRPLSYELSAARSHSKIRSNPDLAVS